MADLFHTNMFKVLSDMLRSESSCLKLVVSDLHVRLKAEEIRMLVMLRMNREFMEYMRVSYPDTPLSEFKEADTYVRVHGGLEGLDDDEDDENDTKVFEMRDKISRSDSLISLQGLTFDKIQ
jgi:hypothetical protein